MRVEYDNVDGCYAYPFSRKDLPVLAEVVDPDTLARVRLIRFGCNNRTTQEARLVGRGKHFDIRINFATDPSLCSRLRSREARYLNVLKALGARIELDSNAAQWSKLSASKYARWLILHEFGHIVYVARNAGGGIAGRTSAAEEAFCDRFAWQGVNHLFIGQERAPNQGFSADGKKRRG